MLKEHIWNKYGFMLIWKLLDFNVILKYYEITRVFCFCKSGIFLVHNIGFPWVLKHSDDNSHTKAICNGNTFLFWVCGYFDRKRDKRAWGEDGEREAEESEKTSDNLLQLPAGRPAEAVSEYAVSGAAGESRAGCLAGTHTDTGGILDQIHF